jgi:hydrogenase/urease accessory protein HupE
VAGRGAGRVSLQVDSFGTAIETFLDGVALFATNPDHVLIVLATSLLAGLRGSPSTRAACFALPLAWCCGGLVGLTWPMPGPLRVPLILSFVIVGGFVALDRKLAPRFVVALAAAAGLLHGYAQGREMAGGGLTWPAVLGAVTVVLLLAAPDDARRVVEAELDAHRRARGGQLDRRDRPADARLAGARHRAHALMARALARVTDTRSRATRSTG